MRNLNRTSDSGRKGGHDQVGWVGEGSIKGIIEDGRRKRGSYVGGRFES